MQDLDLENAMYVIGVLAFAAIFLNQYARWRRQRKQLNVARAQLAALRDLDLVQRDTESNQRPEPPSQAKRWHSKRLRPIGRM